jgi:hypothetical protein
MTTAAEATRLVDQAKQYAIAGQAAHDEGNHDHVKFCREVISEIGKTARADHGADVAAEIDGMLSDMPGSVDG